MMPLRFVLGMFGVVLLGFACEPNARAETPPAPEVAPAQEELFYYPLRAGESLSDVARIFRVPGQDLIVLNQITDPDHLQIGQTIKVPDSFAREATTLRGERDRLLAAQRSAEQEAAERQRVLAGLGEQIRQLETDKSALATELSTTAQWHRTAKLLALLLLVTFGWALKALADRAFAMRKMSSLAAENAALTAAKQKYREAVSHLELRWQKLYRSKEEAPRDIVTDGTERIGRAFDEGAAQIERLLANVKKEREKEELLLNTKHKVLTWLLHPVRELLARYGLKEHTP